MCFAPVLSFAEAPRHPHLEARGTFVDVEGVVQPAPALRFSRAPSELPSAPRAPQPVGALRGWLDPQALERWQSALGAGAPR